MAAILSGEATRERPREQAHPLLPLPTPLPFLNQTMSNTFSFKCQAYCLYGSSDIIRTRNFTIFTVYTKVFRQFMAAFNFL